jgi:hypothetical protein
MLDSCVYSSGAAVYKFCKGFSSRGAMPKLNSHFRWGVDLMSKWFAMLVIVVSCICLPGNVQGQAQITTGNIQGTVSDEKGGSVPEASVEAKNLDTNLLEQQQHPTGSIYSCRCRRADIQ